MKRIFIGFLGVTAIGIALSACATDLPQETTAAQTAETSQILQAEEQAYIAAVSSDIAVDLDEDLNVEEIAETAETAEIAETLQTAETVQMPYIIATTLEEVEQIWALQDGSIPVTNIEVPAILSGESNGIIITEQDLQEAADILNEAVVRNGYPDATDSVITNLVTTRMLRQPSWEEFEPFEVVMYYRTLITNILTFELGSELGLSSPGQTIYFSDEEVDFMRAEAQRLYDEYGRDLDLVEEQARESAQRLFELRFRLTTEVEPTTAQESGSELTRIDPAAYLEFLIERGWATDATEIERLRQAIENGEPVYMAIWANNYPPTDNDQLPVPWIYQAE
ncbi:MAG: hypothetical protein FWG64_14200 [Firmicutes bacterium]|nr:hypothetical protein [Bacillota bacterium]